MKKIFISAIIVLLFACSKREDKKEYYSNGKLKAILTQKNDSIQFKQMFYQNGQLKSEGNIWKDSLELGNWKYYDSLGWHASVTEYFRVADSTRLNQRWVFNQQGDTVTGGYFTYVMKDTITINRYSRVYMSLTQPVISNDSYAYVCIPVEKEVLKFNFSNENEITWDTIHNIAEMYPNHEKYKNWKTNVIFDLQTSSIGQKHLRGFVLEKDTVHVDSFDFVTRKIYFDIPYYVKDSIE